MRCKRDERVFSWAAKTSLFAKALPTLVCTSCIELTRTCSNHDFFWIGWVRASGYFLTRQCAHDNLLVLRIKLESFQCNLTICLQQQCWHLLDWESTGFCVLTHKEDDGESSRCGNPWPVHEVISSCGRWDSAASVDALLNNDCTEYQRNSTYRISLQKSSVGAV